MSQYGVHIDRFTSLDHLSGKQRRDPECVLGVLRETRRFSVWDMDIKPLASTVNGLERSGRIRLDRTTGFPWIGVEITAPADVSPSPPIAESHGVDPRTIKAEVRRIMFARNVHCTVSHIQHNKLVSTGEEWDSREPCGAPAGYATVKDGRVSPRCEKHAKADATEMGIPINENMAIEVRGRRQRRRPPSARPATEGDTP